jgi:hypothetical protein
MFGALRKGPRSAIPVIAIAIISALVIYGPALNTAFLGDDYLLLLASREMGWGEFLRTTWDPGADPGVLQLSANYWRPLSFLTFRLIYEVAGAEPLPYHLVLFLNHAVSIVLVYALAHRLLRSEAGAAAATLVFAVHPAAIDSVTWIATINGLALPFALASSLAFAVAVDGPQVRWKWMAASMALLAIALAYRETAAVFPGAMLIWYLLVPARDRLRERATWLVVALPVLLVAFHAIALAQVFVGDGGRPLWTVGSEAPERAWFYLRQGFAMSSHPGTAAEAWLGRGLALTLVIAPFAALWRRQWLAGALGLGFFVSLAPYVLFSIGYGPRYFYFPSAMLALFAGALVALIAEHPSMAERRPSPRTIGIAMAALLLLVAIPVGNTRVRDWVAGYPDESESWLEGLHAEHPTPPEGAMWIIDAPFAIALVEGYIAGPMLHYFYGEPVPVRVVTSEQFAFVEELVEPGDAIYWWPEARAAAEGP